MNLDGLSPRNVGWETHYATPVGSAIFWSNVDGHILGICPGLSG